MTTTLMVEHFRDRSPAFRLLGTFLAVWHGFLRRREERRALLRLWRLGPRLIRDAGLDPDVVRVAVGGGWDDLPPADLLRRASERVSGRR